MNDVSDYSSDPELNRLKHRLENCGSEFSLFFVRCNLANHLKSVTRQLRDALSRPVIEINLAEIIPEPNQSLDQLLLAKSLNAAQNSVVFLYHLEQLLPASQSLSQHRLAQQINWRRASFQALAKPLVIWLPDHALRTLAELAPDFYDWYSAVYELATPDSLRNELGLRFSNTFSSGTNSVLQGMSLQDKKRWLPTLLDLLNESPPRTRERIKLLRDIAWLQQALGEPQAAEDFMQQALEFAQSRQKAAEIAEIQLSLADLYWMQWRPDKALEAAESALAQFEVLGDVESIAIRCSIRGVTAAYQRDFQAAERWYKELLDIFEKHGNEHGAAITYHQLGMIAQQRRDFEAAQRWYRKSLAIDEKHGNEHVAAGTYHQLGMIAQQQRDFEAAQRWYKQSLAIKEKHGNEHGAAITYAQLGLLAGETLQFGRAGQWQIKAITAFENCHDEYSRDRAVKEFLENLQAAEPGSQTALRQAWRDANLDPILSLEQLEQANHDKA
ncbi:MAG: tetratricopeptide repeat protein [Methylococcales bacterium]